MSESTLLCCLIIIGILGILCAECPPGWLHHMSSCYFFSDNALPWDIAQDVCKGFHGYLAEVETQSESDYLEGISKAYGKFHWLGGKDDVTEGHWYWANSNHPFEYTDWAPGEPNNMGNSEDCLQMAPHLGHHWNDGLCADELNFICETSFTN